MSTTHIQDQPVALDDLSPYRGSWVAIRDGHVVASAMTPTELTGRPDAHDDDFIVFVPTGTSHTLIL